MLPDRHPYAVRTRAACIGSETTRPGVMLLPLGICVHFYHNQAKNIETPLPFHLS